MTKPKTAAQTARLAAADEMRASLANATASHMLAYPDETTPIYNAVLADLTKPKRRAAKR